MRITVPIVILLLMSMVAFGVIRQSILYPQKEFDLRIMRNISFKPFVMQFGELYSDEIDECGDRGMYYFDD